jgi:hypothetical protein
MMMEVVMMDLSTLPPLGYGEVYNWEHPELRGDSRVYLGRMRLRRRWSAMKMTDYYSKVNMIY